MVFTFDFLCVKPNQPPPFQASGIGKGPSRTISLSPEGSQDSEQHVYPTPAYKAPGGLVPPTRCPYLPFSLTYQALTPLASLLVLEFTKLFATSWPFHMHSLFLKDSSLRSIWLVPSPHLLKCHHLKAYYHCEQNSPSSLPPTQLLLSLRAPITTDKLPHFICSWSDTPTRYMPRQ